MKIEGKTIGFVMTESFCVFRKTIEELKNITKLGGKITPIKSKNSYILDTKRGKVEEFRKEIENITNTRILHTTQDIELVETLDIIVVAPATENILSKLSNNIIDDVAVIAVKEHLKRERPVVLGISASDGLSSSGVNIGKLLNMKHYYFVPFKQNNPITKPYSPVFMEIGFYK